jgi:LmbE family N-acetylglucosaminyl deacetylase
VAHPDDEILWFSSIIAQVSRVIVCYIGQEGRPKIAAGREAALHSHPVTSILSLGIEEANVYGLARWPQAIPTAEGLELSCGRTHPINMRYRANHARLVDQLTKRLAGFDAVFTHNPWGEYGHEEHVQVYRAVKQAQVGSGFALWCSSYTGSRTHDLMARCMDGMHVETLTLETDIALARAAEQRYKEQGVWTWFDDYVWPVRESFLRLTHGGNAAQPLQLNYLNTGLPTPGVADRSLRTLVRNIRQRLPLPPSVPFDPV